MSQENVEALCDYHAPTNERDLRHAASHDADDVEMVITTGRGST
jgi:hypothetical protein